MLIGLDPVLTPELLSHLRAMGHGDEIVIADGSFPATTVAKRLVRLDGVGLRRVLRAILAVLPIDESEPDPVLGMEVIGNPDERVPMHAEISAAAALADDRVKLQLLERHAFYRRASEAFAVVATGETAFYGNVIVRKGTIDRPVIHG
ncbi:ribose ABC transporter [Mesorhizobium sp. BR1-1-16]|uniref:RbsD/FucU family protein n=1 Tax=Mesorhizobium sp. BR1-1-16 TaxID=2876653 RepID=UPI001CCCC154|nr:RbsD/FucU domain-containing protein [Mesorhizobium sp. BR1-1-16]MBZ9935569.1 ribose ABC transporter [Mesorhizobium sp. BR1-1-16]